MRGQIRCVLTHTFFEYDLTPLPPTSALARRRITGLRPRGRQRYVLARNVCGLFDLSFYPPDLSRREQEHGPRIAATDVSGGNDGPEIMAPGCGHEAEKVRACARIF